MQGIIRHYSQVYAAYLRTSLAEATSFRAHFFLLICVDVVFYLSTIAAVDIIYNHVSLVGGWSRQEFLFFIAFILAIDHLHMTFISENFWNFSHEVQTGSFDYVLLKPIGSIFITFFQRMRPASLFNVVIPWSLVIYYGVQIGLSWLDYLLLVPLVLMGLTLLVSFEILLSVATFVTVEMYGINFLRMNFQHLSRWPDFVYHYQLRRLFTFVIPVLLVGSAPVRFLLDASDWQPLLLVVIITGVMWLLIGKFWRWGIRSYESASS